MEIHHEDVLAPGGTDGRLARVFVARPIATRAIHAAMTGRPTQRRTVRCPIGTGPPSSAVLDIQMERGHSLFECQLETRPKLTSCKARWT